MPIQTARSVATTRWRGPLGAITFSPDGEPAPAISVFVSDIERFIATTRPFGVLTWWPPVLREQLLGRVLGRVLAHEIGHYVLRSPAHSADGLMRPLQLADDLVGPSRRRFALTAGEVARLQQRVR